MNNESFNSDAEKLNWEQRLHEALRDKAESLYIRYASAKQQPHYGLEGLGGTLIGITDQSADRHYPPREPVLDLGNGRLIEHQPGVRVDAQSGTITRLDGRPPAAFLIDIGTTGPISAVSSSGQIEHSELQDAHYEAFSEPDGALSIYKLDEHQELQPLDPVEGEQLLRQISNSTLA